VRPLFASVLFLAGAAIAGDRPNLHRIDSADYTDPHQYAFLTPLLNGVEVVSLAESIHMTHEFPLIRIGMVRYLNENLGFSTLALEGSPEDLWVTQDQFLASPATTLPQAMSGVFGVWNTTEMAQLFRYEADTWQTAHPLYLTAYDIQPGTGSGTRDLRVFQLLLERLKPYAAPPADFDEAKWMGTAGRLAFGCSHYQPSDEAVVEQAIGALEQWIALAAPEVEKRFPKLPHAAALRLIPVNMRASLSLCKVVGSGTRDWSLYKRTRDTHASQFALALKNVAPGRKLMLWAHISHLFYDETGVSTSVGEILHSSLGPRLYTLATFALGGGTIMLFDDANDDIGYAFVRGNDGPLKQELVSRCHPACFADMRGTSDPLLETRQPVWFESQLQNMTLAKNFDGVVWVERIHTPGMPLGKLLVLAGLHYKKQLAAGGLVILFGTAFAIVRLVRRRILRRRIATA
jgi:erythromycin esterase-like protein